MVRQVRAADRSLWPAAAIANGWAAGFGAFEKGTLALISSASRGVSGSNDCGGTALDKGAEALVLLKAGPSSRALLDERGIE
jgi:hypothetical protein